MALSFGAVALAGPAWEKLPQPVYQLKAGSVVVMDMSLSVYSTDLSPNRLSQMRFKATDLVTEHIDGDIGLIAYAGDAVMYPLYGRRLDNKVIYLPLSAGDQPQPVELQPGTGGGEMPEILAKARRKKVDAEYWRLQLENSGAEYLYLHDNPSRGGVSQELALIRSQPHRFQKLFAENGVYLFRFRR